MKKTPAWDEGKEIPFPIYKARSMAVGEIRKLLPNAQDYQLDSITLEKTEDRWYYRIQFLKLKNSSEGLVTPFSIVILLDGALVEPIITPLR